MEVQNHRQRSVPISITYLPNKENSALEVTKNPLVNHFRLSFVTFFPQPVSQYSK